MNRVTFGTNRSPSISRRSFGKLLLSAAGVSAAGGWRVGAAPAIVTSDALRPQMPSGIAAGDVTAKGAVIWSRSDRPAQMMVELSTTERFERPQLFRGPIARAETDFTTKLRLPQLPAGERIFYRVRFEAVADRRYVSESSTGSFRTVPAGPRVVLFAWSSNTAGQGWGIDPGRGGMHTYEALRRLRPDFFLHRGDPNYS